MSRFKVRGVALNIFEMLGLQCAASLASGLAAGLEMRAPPSGRPVVSDARREPRQLADRDSAGALSEPCVAQLFALHHPPDRCSAEACADSELIGRQKFRLGEAARTGGGALLF